MKTTNLIHVRKGKLSLLTFGFALLFGFALFSSSTLVEESAESLAWTEVYNQNGIVIQYDYSVCNGLSLLCFKIENNNSSMKTVEFTGVITEGSMSQDFDFGRRIEANSFIQGECTTDINPGGIYHILEDVYSNPTVTVSVQ